MSNIILPVKISLYHWGNSLRQSLPELSIPNLPKTDENWWKWADQLIAINRLANITIADKRSFPKPENWRDWAWLFIKNYETINL